MQLRHRLLPLGLIAAAASLAGTGVAQASVLAPCTGSTAVPGAPSQVFQPWNDSSEYSLLPGGNFESGAPSWTLSGAATEVAGNESFDVGSPSDSQSLSLPAGSSATSIPVCVSANDPDIRLFAESSGDRHASLSVSAVVQAFGNTYSIPVARINSGSSWQPTAPIAIDANYLPSGASTPVAFTFTPNGGNWQIDDVYIDPWGMGG